MDTELRSNGERKDVGVEKSKLPFFEEELYYEKPAKKRNLNSFLLLILGIMTTVFCISGAIDVSSFAEGARSRLEMTRFQQLMGDNSSSSAYMARDEVLRYEKNLQRFFIHYDGFDPADANDISGATGATGDEIKQLQIEREIVYQQASREVMDRYNPRISAIEETLGMPEDELETQAESYMDEGRVSINVYVNEDGTSYALRPDSDMAEYYEEYVRLIRERDDLIAGLTEKYLLSDEQATKIIEESKQENTVYDISNYYEIKSYLEDTMYLRYCLKNSRNNSFFTNIPDVDWAAYENPMRFVESESDYYISVQDDNFYIGFNEHPLNEWFKNAGITGYIVAPNPYEGNDPIAVYFKEKTYVRTIYSNFTIAVIIGCIASVFIWMMFIKSDKEKTKAATNAVRKVYRELPFIIKCALFSGACVSIILCIQAFNGVCYKVYNSGVAFTAAPLIMFIAAATVGILYILLCLSHLWEFARKPSIILREPEFRLIARLINNVGLIYGQQVTSLSLSITFLIIAYGLVQLAMVFVLLSYGWFVNSFLFILCELIINILALYVLGLITALAKTNKYMDAVISGDFDAEINEKGGYKAVINKLNRVRGGVRRVVVEKNKSEKMKADLITNVSHDLKTPLTSIINYIELLKSPQITEADRAEYIDVLDRKSQRVKLLIDDLFEATKLSSGQITLEKTELNIVGLLKQAVGELEEKFISAGITLKLTYSNDNIPIAGDGKKLWRVFENLFTNILKYSQPGTRAYVDVCKDDKAVELVFKNISYYEMNFEYEDLFERGKRGDTSRSTEGSGLGLSIAKDIVELHGGTMEICIDGDLFKVEVRLPA